ncbi:MAG: DNA repair protein RadA [Gammaproteobacteria bacterium]|nr:DNA repair protein RadA [Gammaproteobacteria bacterium]
MAKRSTTVFVCSDCGGEHTKWQGQCSFCDAWNTLTRYSPGVAASRSASYSDSVVEIQRIEEVETEVGDRIPSSYSELDRVLGGGLVPGSVILIGGDPGAGKSTLLLQVVAHLSKSLPCLYVSGEESMSQIAARSKRLKLEPDQLNLASMTSVEQVSDAVERDRPAVVVIDSIQVMQTDHAESMAGTVTQVRESAARLTQLAKRTNTVFFLVGHVTKEGNLAGPKVLEHIIDCMVMLDAPSGSRYRTLRSAKNRFGAVNELGVFAMTDAGLREVRNPSAIFLERSAEVGPGSVVSVIWEGTRPLLVEIQALVDDVQGGYPRRVAVGLDAQRLAMHLAIMHRHGGLALSNDDVFVNVTGGVKVLETATDLASMLAVYSSLRNLTLPSELIVFGELGLTGEIRPVPNGQERLREAVKHGFTHAVIPYANRPSKPIEGMTTYPVKTLQAALDAVNTAD